MTRIRIYDTTLRDGSQGEGEMLQEIYRTRGRPLIEVGYAVR